MVLTNAERQARHRERIRNAAAKVSALDQFIDGLRYRIEHTRERIEMLKDGRLALHSLEAGGYVDITHEAIAREERMLAEDERIVAMHDGDVGAGPAK
jgi:hypothetical protein